jgi:prevent-host-death family protein
MVQVAVSEFRGHLNKYLNAVQRGETIVLTSRNHEVARVVAPVDKKTQAREKLNELRKTAQICDVLSPTGETWKAAE